MEVRFITVMRLSHTRRLNAAGWQITIVAYDASAWELPVTTGLEVESLGTRRTVVKAVIRKWQQSI